MKMAIWKFPLDGATTGESELRLPTGARPLHIGEQGGRLCLWAAVKLNDEGQPPLGAGEDRRALLILATGRMIHCPGDTEFLRLTERAFRQSVIMPGGFVWHVFLGYPIEDA